MGPCLVYGKYIECIRIPDFGLMIRARGLAHVQRSSGRL